MPGQPLVLEVGTGESYVVELVNAACYKNKPALCFFARQLRCATLRAFSPFNNPA